MFSNLEVCPCRISHGIGIGTANNKGKKWRLENDDTLRQAYFRRRGRDLLFGQSLDLKALLWDLRSTTVLLAYVYETQIRQWPGSGPGQASLVRVRLPRAD